MLPGKMLQVQANTRKKKIQTAYQEISSIKQ